jgi:hypothetical protein
MPLENVANRLIRNRITQIRHRTHDPVIAPTRILPGRRFRMDSAESLLLNESYHTSLYIIPDLPNLLDGSALGIR